MKTKLILACAGLAVCGASQGQLEIAKKEHMGSLRPIAMTKIVGLTADGMPILGERIEVNPTNGSENAGRAIEYVYDSIGLGADTDGDGFPEVICGQECEGGGNPAFGPSSRFVFTTVIAQVHTDDYSMPAAAGGAFYDGGIFAMDQRGDCVLGAENLLVVINFFESQDTTGTGFDNDGDGQNDAPYDVTTFTGGIIFDYGLVPPPAGYYTLLADGAAVLEVPLPNTDLDGDASTVEGTWEVIFASDFIDTDGDGFGDVLVPSTNTVMALGGTDADSADTAGCRAANSVGAGGTTTPGFWAEGENFCGDPLVFPPWSDGGLFPAVDGLFDPFVDFFDVGGGPNGCPTQLSWAIGIAADVGGTPARLCADTNLNGVVEPGDFGAWVAAFNASDLIADANQNGAVDPGDFGAWVSAFNLGAAGPTCTP